jgi:predicted transcriptional regulator
MKLIEKIKNIEKQMSELNEEIENLKQLNNIRYEG